MKFSFAFQLMLHLTIFFEGPALLSIDFYAHIVKKYTPNTK